MSEKYYLGGVILAVLGLVVCFDGLKTVRGQNFDEPPSGFTEAAPLGDPASNSKFTENFTDTVQGTTSAPFYNGEDPSAANSFRVQRGFKRTTGKQQQLQIKIREAVKKIREAGNEKATTEIVLEMNELFSQYFDQEIKQREEKLAPLENRVKKLRAQIDKRKEAKVKIIELQIQLMVSQAEGLGFFTEPGTVREVSPWLEEGADNDWAPRDATSPPQSSGSRRRGRGRSRDTGSDDGFGNSEDVFGSPVNKPVKPQTPVDSATPSEAF